MKQTLRKIKRVEPLIKMREAQLDGAMRILNEVRAEKHAIVKAMRESQNAYMAGVEKLNKIRSSTDRANLETMERGLDAVKSRWYQLYRKVQEVEAREKAQIAAVLAAEQELKATARLKEKYEDEFKKDFARHEQKAQDENILRKLAARS